MPLLEEIAEIPQEAFIEEVAAQPPVPEYNMSAGDEFAQGYEYTRQDGTVEHAANRDEAIELCPVLGKLALKNPEAAALLLDVAAIGQAKMTEKSETPEPEKTKRSEPVKPVERTKSDNQTRLTLEQAAHPALRTEALAATTAANLQRQFQNVEPVENQPANKVMPEQAKPKVSKPEELAPEPVDPVQHLHERQRVSSRQRLELNRQAQAQPTREKEYIKVPSQAESNTTELRQEPIKKDRKATENQVLGVEPVPKPAVQRSDKPQAQVKHSISFEDTAALPNIVEVPPEGQLDFEQVETEWSHARATIELADLESMFKVTPDETSSELTEYSDPLLLLHPELDQITEHSEPMRWAGEAEREPLQIYEDFSEALQSMITASGMQPEAEFEHDQTTIGEGEQADAFESKEIKHYPAIVLTVAERLNELEYETKEKAAPYLTNIVETLHVIEILETEEVELEAMEATQVELEDQVLALFQQLEIDFEAEEVKAFTAIVLSAAFHIAQPAAEITSVDLTRHGTREAKHFSYQITNFSNTEEKTQRLLGKFILFLYLITKPALTRAALSN